MTKWTASAACLVLCLGFGCNRSDAPPSSAPERNPVTPAEIQHEPLAPAAALAPQPGAAKNEPERRPDVVFVPTPQPVVDKMLEVADIKPNEVVYDLGCGDGRIVVTAAKRYGVRAYGFDIDPARVSEALENVAKNGVQDLVSIEQRDIFALDLSPANVVTLYLLPELNVKLLPQLAKLRPGSRVVSHDFDIRGVKPALELELEPAGTTRKHAIFLFKAPLEKDPPLSVRRKTQSYF